MDGWAILATVPANVTQFAVDNDALYRDRTYEFRVLAVSQSAYSEPSAAITASTRGQCTSFFVVQLPRLLLSAVRMSHFCYLKEDRLKY